MTKKKTLKRFLHALLIVLLTGPAAGLLAQEGSAFRLTAKPYGIVYQSRNHYPGSEFLFDSWVSGDVRLENGQVIRGLKINYNAFTDALIYSGEDNISIEISKAQVSSFLVKDNAYERLFILYPNDRNSDQKGGSQFVEVLYNGDNKLYAKRKFKINEMLVQDNPFRKSVYYPDDKYYAQVQGEWVLRPGKPSSYYAIYGKSRIKKLMHSHKLSLNKEEDLVRFLSELDKQEPLTAEKAIE
ncbi:MAG: hypothetical protein JW801_09320 [Bacteroidales bacterium]|nr:hypothetical protein [Bacteroidales bacterium]